MALNVERRDIKIAIDWSHKSREIFLGKTLISCTQFGRRPKGFVRTDQFSPYTYIKAPVRYFASLTPELSNSSRTILQWGGVIGSSQISPAELIYVELWSSERMSTFVEQDKAASDLCSLANLTLFAVRPLALSLRFFARGWLRPSCQTLTLVLWFHCRGLGHWLSLGFLFRSCTVYFDDLIWLVSNPPFNSTIYTKAQRGVGSEWGKCSSLDRISLSNRTES